MADLTLDSVPVHLLKMNKIDLDSLSPLCRVIPRGDDAVEFVCPVSDKTKLNNQLFYVGWQ